MDGNKPIRRRAMVEDSGDFLFQKYALECLRIKVLLGSLSRTFCGRDSPFDS